jgi:hypothetical protein
VGSLVNNRSFLLACSLLSLSFSSSPAQAGGRLLARGGADVPLREARVALSQGPSRATAWYQLLLDGSAEELLWLLPVPPGAAVDVATSSFFDGLEESTAPRVLAPSGASPKNQSCTKPSPVVVSSGEGGKLASLVGQEVFSEAAAVSPKLKEMGYDLTPQDGEAIAAALEGGGRLLALRLGPAAGGATIPVRVHGPGVGLGALGLLRATQEAVPYTVWTIGSSRGRLQGAGELILEPSSVRWTTQGGTNYEALRSSLLDKDGGKSLLLQVAGPGPLRDLTALPGGQEIPPFLDAYLRRAFERGEASGDLGVASGEARLALDEVQADGCPRGDLLPPEGFTCPAPGAQDPLVPSSQADDLSFVFAGDAAIRWVSRFSGRIPASAAAPAAGVTFPGGGPVSLLLTPANVWDALCTTIGAGGTTGAGGLGGGGFSGGGPGPSGTGGSTIIERETVVVREPSPGWSCANVFVGDSCSGDSSSGEESEGCNCSDTSTGEGDDVDVEDGSSEGCSCDDSSSGESGDSCSESDSGGDGAGEACSGGDGAGDSCSGSSGGSSCANDCSTGRRGRRSPRLSKWLMVAAMLVLPLRRWSRPRQRKQRGEREQG